MRRRRTSSLALGLAALAGLAGTARAQSCVGLPAAGNGLLAVGFVGTDGQSGHSGGAAVRYGGRGAELQYRRFDGFANGTPWELAAQTSQRLSAPAEPRRSTCLVAGLAGYQANFDESGAAGQVIHYAETYQRLRVPVGVARGRELSVLWGQFALIPFASAGALYQFERYDDPTTGRRTRSQIAPQISAGFGIRSAPFVLRTRVDWAWLRPYSLNGQHNWFVLNVQLGLGL